MNREGIINMAREACDTDKVDAWHNGFWTLTQGELERFAALVAEAEREECAKVCDELGEASNLVYAGTAAIKCAAAIRARGNK
jgi:hypothetical protein